MDDFNDILHDATAMLGAMPAAGRVKDHPVLARMAFAMALSHCRITIDMVPGTTEASVATTPDVSGLEAGASFLDQLRTVASAGFSDNPPRPLRSILELDDAADLTVAMLVAGADAEEVGEPFDTVAAALQGLDRMIDLACTAFVGGILVRDLGLPGGRSGRVNTVCNWALCHPLSGLPGRQDALTRRMQALDAYGAVSSVLMDKEVTAAIDEGRELAPILMQKLHLDRERLGHINGHSRAAQALTAWNDSKAIIGKLLLHGVAPHRWPVELGNIAWNSHSQMLEPAYVADSTGRDALTAFMRDIVQPLAVMRTMAAALEAHPDARRFVAAKDIPATRPLVERTVWIETVANAILGGRGPKAYNEAAAKWHRRVASVSALRLEHTAPAPGWPALCPVWTSDDGRATVTAIVTAEGLVDEGNVMQHCVGGYYSECRTGRTHILSYAFDGVRSATLELHVRAADGKLSIKRGQFEGYKRAQPDDRAHADVTEMLQQIRDGRHKVDVRVHERFAKERQRQAEYDDGTIMPVEFVRKVWPLYLALMPRGTPDTFDEWAATTPLAAAMDAEIARCTSTQMRKAA